MKTIEQHTREIHSLFANHRLIEPTKTCDNPAYALSVEYQAGTGSDNRILDIEFWPDKKVMELRLVGYISTHTFDLITIFKIEGDSYRSLIKVEVLK